MRILPFLLVLLFGCSGLPVLAQQRDSLKGEVYSVYLRRAIERKDSRTHDKIQSVVVIPAPLARKGSIDDPLLLRSMTPRRLTRNDTVQAPDPAGLQWQLLPTGHRNKENNWEFNDWVRADTALRSMGRQFDAITQTPPVVAGPVAVPGVAVLLEGSDFFKSERWQSREHDERKNKHNIGVVAFSDVIFSADGRYAVFFVVNSLGRFSSSGAYAFMEKIAQGWQVKFDYGCWSEMY